MEQRYNLQGKLLRWMFSDENDNRVWILNGEPLGIIFVQADTSCHDLSYPRRIKNGGVFIVRRQDASNPKAQGFGCIASPSEILN